MWYIPAMSPMLTYRRYIPGIYQVYTNVGDIHGIYQGYIIYILGIYQVNTLTLVYTWYIPDIYRLYGNVTELDTWWLVLRARTGPHSSRASCDDISRPCDYSDFITARAPTARILALGHVVMQGAL